LKPSNYEPLTHKLLLMSLCLFNALSFTLNWWCVIVAFGSCFEHRWQSHCFPKDNRVIVAPKPNHWKWEVYNNKMTTVPRRTVELQSSRLFRVSECGLYHFLCPILSGFGSSSCVLKLNSRLVSDTLKHEVIVYFFNPI